MEAKDGPVVERVVEADEVALPAADETKVLAKASAPGVMPGRTRANVAAGFRMSVLD